MKNNDPYSVKKCPLGYALKAIEGKWKLPALWVLCDKGTLRYNELRSELGITNTMLSSTLKELEEYGLVERIQYNEIPPRVDYSVTELGRKLVPTLKAFSCWGEALMEANSCADGDCADGAACEDDDCPED